MIRVFKRNGKTDVGNGKFFELADIDGSAWARGEEDLIGIKQIDRSEIGA